MNILYYFFREVREDYIGTKEPLNLYNTAEHYYCWQYRENDKPLRVYDNGSFSWLYNPNGNPNGPIIIEMTTSGELKSFSYLFGNTCLTIQKEKIYIINNETKHLTIKQFDDRNSYIHILSSVKKPFIDREVRVMTIPLILI